MPNPKPPRRTKATKVADVGAAIAARTSRVGKTIQLRAIRRGYYGVQGGVADIREPGDVIQFAVKDLEPVTDLEAFAKAEYADGIAKRSIVIDGATYALPSWLVDPKAPVDADEDDDDELEDDAGDAGKGSGDQDVI